jgi:acyl-CoA hydrolase
VVKCAPPSAGRQNARTVVRCNFTFVGLGLLGSAVEVPQLLVQTDDERLRFQKGRERYEATKSKLRKTKSAG